MKLRIALCRGGRELKDSTRPDDFSGRLEGKKGYVEHDVEGRTYIYRPRIEPHNVATQQGSAEFIDRFLLCRGLRRESAGRPWWMTTSSPPDKAARKLGRAHRGKAEVAQKERRIETNSIAS